VTMKWFDFVEIKFHLFENIKWHNMQLELNTIFESDSNSLNGIQIIILNSIQDNILHL
jgi:hypothetical protein